MCAESGRGLARGRSSERHTHPTHNHAHTTTHTQNLLLVRSDHWRVFPFILQLVRYRYRTSVFERGVKDSLIVNIIKLLLENGSDLNGEVDGINVLDLALSTNKNNEIIDILRKYGAKTTEELNRY